jgi:hypothetical protein
VAGICDSDMPESCQRGWDKYGGSLKIDEKI